VALFFKESLHESTKKDTISNENTDSFNLIFVIIQLFYNPINIQPFI